MNYCTYRSLHHHRSLITHGFDQSDGIDGLTCLDEAQGHIQQNEGSGSSDSGWTMDQNRRVIIRQEAACEADVIQKVCGRYWNTVVRPIQILNVIQASIFTSLQIQQVKFFCKFHSASVWLTWASVSMNSLWTKCPKCCCDWQQMTRSPTRTISPISGQYRWHLMSPRSDSGVTMAISGTPCRHTTDQKSSTVCGSGPGTQIHDLRVPRSDGLNYLVWQCSEGRCFCQATACWCGWRWCSHQTGTAATLDYSHLEKSFKNKNKIEK